MAVAVFVIVTPVGQLALLALVCVLRVMVLVVPGAIVPKLHVSVVPPASGGGEAGEQLCASAPPTVQVKPLGTTSVSLTFVELAVAARSDGDGVARNLSRVHDRLGRGLDDGHVRDPRPGAHAVWQRHIARHVRRRGRTDARRQGRVGGDTEGEWEQGTGGVAGSPTGREEDSSPLARWNPGARRLNVASGLDPTREVRPAQAPAERARPDRPASSEAPAGIGIALGDYLRVVQVDIALGLDGDDSTRAATPAWRWPGWRDRWR